MRVYELSKQSGISSKIILDILKSGGFDVSSHMSVLSDEAISFFSNSQNSGKKNMSSDSVSIKSGYSEPDVSVNNDSNKLKSASNIKDKDSGSSSSLKNSKAIKSEATSLEKLANLLQIHSSELIVHLLKQGVVCSKNQILKEAIVSETIKHFGFEVESIKKDNNADSSQDRVVRKIKLSENSSKNLQPRDPVVAVVGHVDHGKTSLLDFIRKTKVAEKEAGGITQHLGAYKVNTKSGNMVFLDTPGHEVFSAIRARGLSVADIVILLIAADDGVKPQTIEAIEYIKKIEAPVVVAVNKIDKAPDRLDDIKTQLSQYGIMPEDWGGDAIIVPISAKTGKNIDELLDMVNLQAEMLELKANKNIPAEGYVLESNMKKGRGVVATFLGQQGTLNVGDYFLCGNVKGRVTSLLSSSGKKLSKASVSEPVLISGFDGMPSAGDRLKIVSFAEYKKGEKSKAKSPIFGKFNFSESVVTNDFEYKNPEITFNLLVKADTDSSREAVCLSIEKLNKNIGSSVFKIISSGVGNITEGDISFADSIKAQIYGFGVKEDSQAKDIAKTKKVTVKNFNIIYKLSEDLESLYKENKKKQIIKEKVGSILIKKIFNIKGTGVIAGFVVQNGYVARESSVMIYRDKTCIGEGPLKSLQSDKKTVPKILSGREGAFLVDNFNDWVVGDQVEVYSVKKQ